MIIGGSCHKYHFCRDKFMLGGGGGGILVTTKLLLQKNIFLSFLILGIRVEKSRKKKLVINC